MGPAMIPLFLDLRGRKVVIFGGGKVALRKARFFASAARVTVVSPSFVEGFEGLPIKRIRRRVKAPWAYLRGSTIVVPATDDPSLNNLIAREAHRRRQWVDRVDGPGDVMVPSVVRRGEVVVAIATGGVAPVLSRYLRERIEASVGPEVATMAELLGEYRKTLKGSGVAQGDREDLLRSALGDEGLWDLVRRGDVKGARGRLRGVIQTASGEAP